MYHEYSFYYFFIQIKSSSNFLNVNILLICIHIKIYMVKKIKTVIYIKLLSKKITCQMFKKYNKYYDKPRLHIGNKVAESCRRDSIYTLEEILKFEHSNPVSDPKVNENIKIMHEKIERNFGSSKEKFKVETDKTKARIQMWLNNLTKENYSSLVQEYEESDLCRNDSFYDDFIEKFLNSIPVLGSNEVLYDFFMHVFNGIKNEETKNDIKIGLERFLLESIKGSTAVYMSAFLYFTNKKLLDPLKVSELCEEFHREKTEDSIDYLCTVLLHCGGYLTKETKAKDIVEPIVKSIQQHSTDFGYRIRFKAAEVFVLYENDWECVESNKHLQKQTVHGTEKDLSSTRTLNKADEYMLKFKDKDFSNMSFTKQDLQEFLKHLCTCDINEHYDILKKFNWPKYIKYYGFDTLLGFIAESQSSLRNKGLTEESQRNFRNIGSITAHLYIHSKELDRRESEQMKLDQKRLDHISKLEFNLISFVSFLEALLYAQRIDEFDNEYIYDFKLLSEKKLHKDILDELIQICAFESLEKHKERLGSYRGKLAAYNLMHELYKKLNSGVDVSDMEAFFNGLEEQGKDVLANLTEFIIELVLTQKENFKSYSQIIVDFIKKRPGESIEHILNMGFMYGYGAGLVAAQIRQLSKRIFTDYQKGERRNIRFDNCTDETAVYRKSVRDNLIKD